MTCLVSEGTDMIGREVCYRVAMYDVGVKERSSMQLWIVRGRQDGSPESRRRRKITAPKSSIAPTACESRSFLLAAVTKLRGRRCPPTLIKLMLTPLTTTRVTLPYRTISATAAWSIFDISAPHLLDTYAIFHPDPSLSTVPRPARLRTFSHVSALCAPVPWH